MRKLSIAQESIVSNPGFVRAFAAEFRRRQVLRVIALYAIGAWLILQIAEVTFGPLGVPDWIMRALIIGAIVGFPIAFVLAWIIDLTPQGFIFDLPLWQRDTPDRRRRDSKFDVLVVVVLFAIIGMGAYTLVGSLLTGKTQVVAKVIRPLQHSIAVFAFENFDGESATTYFAGGLAEEILSMLSTLPELNVAARSSSFRFQNQSPDVREAARLLDVEYILEGSVRQGGDRIRATVRLIEGVKGFQVWTKTYDRLLEDVIALQQEIATAVVNELEITLSVDSSESLRRAPTNDTNAYDYYLQGRERLRRPRNVGVLEVASELFLEALAIDPSFARAHAGNCEALLGLYKIGVSNDNFQKAETACAEAERLSDGRNADVYIALGTLYRFRGLHERARQQLEKAIALSPGAVDAYIELGEINMADGDIEAAEATFIRAVDLKRGYWRAYEALGNFYFKNERYQEAVDAYQTVTNLMPDSANGFSGLGAAYWMLDEAEPARVAWNRSLSLKPTRTGYTNLGLRYYYAGEFEDAAMMQKKALEIAPDDHRVWGRLAESYRFIPGSQALARDAYTRAAELAEQSLAINENDWTTTGLLAIYYSHTDRLAQALELADDSVEASKKNAEAYYYQALVMLKANDVDGALLALENTVVADESYRKFLITDPDMQALVNNPLFRQLAEI